MDYGKTLSKAWNIVWANKWLFVLGFLAALGSGGSGGSGNFNFSGPGTSGGSDFGPSGDIASTFNEYLPIIIAVSCFFVLLAIGLWLLRLIGEAGMIASVDRIEAGESLTLGDGFRVGRSFLKQMVGLSLVLFGPFLLIGLIMAGVAIAIAIGGVSSGSEEFLASSFGLFALCAIPLICILAIVGLVIQFVYPMAQRGIILHKLGVMDGIRHGWQLLRENIGEIIVFALIFFVIGIAAGLATLIIALPLALVFIVPFVISIINGGTVITALMIILGVIGLLVFILLAAAIGSIVRTLQSTTFTLAYHQWAGKKAAATAV
jgi:hypothetical protein